MNFIWRQSMFYGCKDRQEKSSRIAFPVHVQSGPEYTKPDSFSKEVRLLEECPAIGSQE